MLHICSTRFASFLPLAVSDTITARLVLGSLALSISPFFSIGFNITVNVAGLRFMPRAMLESVDLNSTYMNAFTAKRLLVGKIPLLAETELQAMQVMANFRQDEDPGSLRLAWIKNTSKLDEMWASSALLEEAKANPNLEVIAEPAPLGFDVAGCFVLPSV